MTSSAVSPTTSPRWQTTLARPWLYWPLLIGSAAATPWAFAPYRLFWLLPLLFALLVLLTLLRPDRQIRSAYLWGLVAYSAQFYWINIALHDVAGLPQLFAIPLTLLLPAYLAVYPALSFWLLGLFRLPESLRMGVVLPLLWTLTEFIREHALTGFGWGALGYSQIAASPLAAWAPLSGIALVTLATACTGAWLALLLKGTQSTRMYASIGLVALWLGSMGLARIHWTQPDGSHARVALAQGNIAQSLKWDEAQFAPTLTRYYQQVQHSQADIIILPETAIPVMRQDLPPQVLSAFAAAAKHNHAALAVGMVQYTSDGRGYQNAVVNLADYHDNTPEATLPYYAKNHLVPFGEYIPLPALTGWLYQLMNMPLAGFSGGGDAQAPLRLGNQRVAFNICYEDGFGDELIASAKQSSLLANISNMAWYGQSHAMDQHLQQSQARALEMGRYMVRATNTGMTAVINPKGEITALLPPDTAQVLTAEIQGQQGNTPYMQLGSSRPLMALLVLLCVALWWRGRRHKPATKA
ncbi:apolipoprotein N-acyltransferase [Snodgrassella sp. CFCC 13594]|uniref:apolipoprotein N-acyltransferase n=1 Tax=Snodgrassella sp. CFCC 13594 TaxID=1775559 RepID=UPI00082C39D4|nr:apolipoprotein N-acyltransferase [Snodgrassella sp. CFCC 13594]